MVEMSAQEMQDFAKTLAPSADLDDQVNEAYNRPAAGASSSGDPRDRKPKYDLYKVDYKWVDN